MDDDDEDDEEFPLRMVIVKSRALVRTLLSECDDNDNDNDNGHGDDGRGGFNNSNNNNLNPTSNSNSTSKNVRIDSATGLIINGADWFNSSTCNHHHNHCRCRKEKALFRRCDRFKHPLKAPLILSPNDDKTPICRYHNYHRDGCKLYNRSKTNKHNNNIIINKNGINIKQESIKAHDINGNTNVDANANAFVATTTTNICTTDICPFDHDYCHACRQLGHVAKDCLADETKCCY